MSSKIGAGVKCQNKGINPEGEEEGKALSVPVLELDFMAKEGCVSCLLQEHGDDVNVTLNPVLSALGLESALGSELSSICWVTFPSLFQAGILVSVKLSTAQFAFKQL